MPQRPRSAQKRPLSADDIGNGGKLQRLLWFHDRVPAVTRRSANLRKLKEHESGSGPSASGKRLKKWVSEFGNVPGNKKYGLYTLLTKPVLSIFDQLPESLMVDVTSRKNRSKYKVFSFMAHDTFGKCKFVQHALLQNERSATLQERRFIDEIYKKVNVYHAGYDPMVHKDYI
ncbi:hypothetical protein F444_17774 [Phytophthora nicotianae P1976]|uniref:ZSWIM1/3 RNaseH-like domain-containing protein n=1 Tax=Phytophthora nicotianae P1976 TaxID=1317066 RepID=A0A080ZDR4_PHYNI|nr:hypothetical protein F444_17774 [Phytophthora nicotianae P1976]